MTAIKNFNIKKLYILTFKEATPWLSIMLSTNFLIEHKLRSNLITNCIDVK